LSAIKCQGKPTSGVIILEPLFFMKGIIKRFLIFELLGFSTASLVHSGVLVHGYEHPKARIAEGVIAVILFVGLILTIVFPAKIRPISFTVQGFALLTMDA
jgi:hypothetical protein